MFTGIIQAIGSVADLEPTPSGQRLWLAPVKGWDLQVGESVAVNGCCLTALGSGDIASFDLSPETLQRSSLGALKKGSPVNLERALRVGDSLGGHFVSGHVDGLATLVTVEPQGEGGLWTFEAPAELARFIAHKGSVSLDGISLTPFGVEGARFNVALIPHTLQATNLGSRKVGDRLNLEIDVLARYMERFMQGQA
jgi:riboflavin synthase